MKFLSVLFVLLGLAFPALAVDREAFTFTNYDLDVRVEPEQQRLAVRGRIALRNDSASPQKTAVLQISSTLAWRSIKIDGKPLEFTSHSYASDIDHTGAVSEALVTLPQDIPPRGTLDLDVGYEGVIPLDATRLTRIGVPEDKARHTDWDQISKSFSAVRGVGYVAWYPVATDGVSLSDGNTVAEALGRWNAKQFDAAMHLQFESTSTQAVLFTGVSELPSATKDKAPTPATYKAEAPGIAVPTFVVADYEKLTSKESVTVEYLPGQEDAAASCLEAAAQLDPGIPPVGRGSETLQILGLPDPDASSFVTGGMLLTPLKLPFTNDIELSIVYAKARSLVFSPRPWIQEGLAHYAQAQFVERQQTRQAAIDYLNAHASVLIEAEKAAAQNPSTEWQATNSLINRPPDLQLQAKAMYVWWMLKDMLGNLPSLALIDYRVADDKDAAYMQRLIQQQSHRDLEWFFDDWVYRDRGLPDFRVASVYPREIVSGGYMVTVEIENLGNAGAEVPVTLRIPGNDITKRLEVRAKSKASIRVEAPSIPEEIVVNDGSVPESDISNNRYQVRVQAK